MLHGMAMDDVHWQAVLVRSEREGDKVKQKHIASLGGFTEMDLVKRPYGADHFWIMTRDRLDRLSLSPDERKLIELGLLRKLSEVKARSPNVTSVARQRHRGRLEELVRLRNENRAAKKRN